MKTKLTLFAVAFIAVCAFAAQSVLKADPAPMSESVEKAAPQKRAAAEPETILFSPNAVTAEGFETTVTYTDNQVISGTDVSITLGNDQNPGIYKVSTPDLKGAFPEFEQTDAVPVAGDEGLVMKTRAVAINGGNNPKDRVGKNSGSGFNATEGKATANLPQSGTYFIFDVAKAGTLKVGIVLNSGKAFYVIDATNAYTEPIAEGSEETYLKVALPDANITHANYVIENKDGVVEVADASDGKGGGEVADKVEGTVTFDVEAGHKYYIFCTGSKLGCFGCMFTPAAEPEAEDITIAPESGDIYAAYAEAAEGKLVRNITINLNEGAAYTISAPIEAPANVTINGNKATIDASALADAFVKMSATPTGTPNTKTNDAGEEVILSYPAAVTFKDMTVTGLKYQLFYANKQKYLLSELLVDNCVIGIDGSNNKAVFDFNSGGNTSALTVRNSTIYAYPANTFKGGFFSTQSSQAVPDLGGTTKVTTIENSTIYNIAYGKDLTTRRKNSQDYMTYVVKNSVLVNSGRSGAFLRGLNSGQPGAGSTWEVSGNVFNYDGADTSEAEASGMTHIENLASIAGMVTFTNAANGDFSGKFEYTSETAPEKIGGDPRWTYTIEQAPVDIEISPADGDISTALAAAEAGIEKVRNITINLTEGAAYTISAPIEASANVTINGNKATIDASALADAFVKMTATPLLAPNTNTNDAGEEVILSYPAAVTFKDMTVTGLKYQLFYANKQKYLLSELLVDNCVIGIDGSNNKAVFDFNSGGNTSALTVRNSTIYANPANTFKGGFFSTQSSQAVPDLGGTTKVTTIENSTIYNIAYGKDLTTRRKNSQDYMTYVVKNSVLVNSGRSGAFLRGLNSGQPGAGSTWEVSGNVFNYDGADTSEAEASGMTHIENPASIGGVVTFTDAANGDFNGSMALAFGVSAPEAVVGDPRWTLNFEENNEMAIWTSEEAVEVNWNDVAVAAAEKFADARVGDVIHIKLASVVEGATKENWKAQVAIKTGWWTDLEAGFVIATTDTEATFVITGDILRLINEQGGLMASGSGYTTKLITLERTELTGSDKSIWVGKDTGKPTINQNHFKNNNVAVGDIIRIAATATEGEGDKYIVLSYSGSDTSWSWVNIEGVTPVTTETGFDVTVTAEMIPILTTDGLIINQAGYELTQVELIQPEDITVDVESGDIAQAIADASAGKLIKGITINLKKDVAYIISAPVVANAGIIVNGNGATVDASAVEGDLFQLSTTPAVDAVNDYFRVESMKIADVTITGIKRSIIYDNNTKYCVVDLTIDNCVFGLATEKVSNDALISFQGGGVKDFTIKNSTVYGNAVAKYFIRYNNSSRLDRYGFDTATDFQTMTYLNNTFYKVIQDGGQWGNYNGIGGQLYSKFDVQKNIWVDCSTDIIRRMAGGRFNGNNPMTFSLNTYFYNGTDRSASEASYDNSGNILTTNPGFKDADNADFALAAPSDQAKNSTGDPRWGTYEAFTVNVVAENCEVIVTPYAAEGTKVYVDVKPDEGYEVSGGTVVNDATGEEIQVVEETVDGQEVHYFVMPAANVTVTMTVVKLSKVTLNEVTNGQVTVVSVNMQDDPYAETGKKVCIMVNPESGYELQDITVKDANEADVEVVAEEGTEHGQNYNYYFIMPESDVTITVTFAIINTINGIAADELNDGEWYNLQGVRVEKPVKGVFIHKGKKVVVK